MIISVIKTIRHIYLSYFIFYNKQKGMIMEAQIPVTFFKHFFLEGLINMLITFMISKNQKH